MANTPRNTLWIIFYLYDVIDQGKYLEPSERGELGISSVNQNFLDQKD